MTTRRRCLLLDANVVITLYAEGIWERGTKACEILVPETVVDESRFHSTDLAGFAEPIDLRKEEGAGRVRVVSATASEILDLRQRFAPWFLELIQAGEIEALMLLLFRPDLDEDMCTGDGPAIQTAAMLGLSERVVSLERVLREVGLGRTLERQFGQEFLSKALGDTLTMVSRDGPLEKHGGFTPLSWV